MSSGETQEALRKTPPLSEHDPDVARIIHMEEQRQRDKLGLIASENFCSCGVRKAVASVLTDKYAEGYPGDRWYGGCEYVDKVEELAISRCCDLFGADHANVQPHAGSQANMAVCLSVLKPGDTILGMSLAHGGHLTHGHNRNFSGSLYRALSYGVKKDTNRIDYDEVARLAEEHNPRLIVAGASAYSRDIKFDRFRAIADEVNAYLLVDMAHIAGIVAADLHSDPVPHADFVTATTHKTLRGPRGGFILCRQEHADRIDKSVFPGIQGGPLMHVIAGKAVAFGEALDSGFTDYQEQTIANAAAMADELMKSGFSVVTDGTDNHLFLLDLRGKDITGKEAETVLEKANIILNKNAVPFDPRPPAESSGVRIGTPSLTTRGMGEDQARTVAGWIADILGADTPASVAESVGPKVTDLCREYPPPFART